MGYEKSFERILENARKKQEESFFESVFPPSPGGEGNLFHNHLWTFPEGVWVSRDVSGALVCNTTSSAATDAHGNTTLETLEAAIQAMEACAPPSVAELPDMVMLERTFRRVVKRITPIEIADAGIKWWGVSLYAWERLNEEGRAEMKKRVAACDVVWLGDIPEDFEPPHYWMRLKDKALAADERN